ncbi:MAG: hypothetical protein WBF90_27660 [Rivularia sp. (in: cyanobacteria)]|uniref:CopG family ribbon-helix-helix protein n=1 Tax=Rivularia sp. UHCC 0363 TaxID=3110244 RepID=UPI002B1EDD4A|nr:hypothetical protein [Rivularia sp. UHCC 0363]MEA5596984.1 hypothetical protein [Rivularia sp. UHCC 0363]
MTDSTFVSASNNKEPPKENIGARIPVTWLQEIQALSNATGLTKTEIMNEAIGQYLQQNIDTIPNRITALEDKLSLSNGKPIVDNHAINERLDKLEAMIQSLINEIKNIQPETKVIEKYKETIYDAERYGGITLTHLLEKYHLKYNQIKKEASEKNIQFHELVQQKTGWHKKHPNKRRGKWFPQDNRATTTIRNFNQIANADCTQAIQDASDYSNSINDDVNDNSYKTGI